MRLRREDITLYNVCDAAERYGSVIWTIFKAYIKIRLEDMNEKENDKVLSEVLECIRLEICPVCYRKRDSMRKYFYESEDGFIVDVTCSSCYIMDVIVSYKSRKV